MASKLTLLINWGYTVEKVSWLPLKYKNQTNGKLTIITKLRHPIHYAITGKHIYVSQQLYCQLSSEDTGSGQKLSIKALLQTTNSSNRTEDD